MTLRCTSPVYARTYFLDASTEGLQTQDAANVGDMYGFRLRNGCQSGSDSPHKSSWPDNPHKCDVVALVWEINPMQLCLNAVRNMYVRTHCLMPTTCV